MKGLLAIGIGGGIGSLARYTIAICAEKWTPVKFPLGTLTANLLGCLLGGFTTFSTFARETEDFFRAGEPLHAISYILASNILGIIMVALGFIVCQRIIR